ncbi:MAG: ZPR1 zinc finger domain-containing protein [DPANN group archaeon]|nr:ZPR1 zinc finger domain-containing protein [DPANN group archaeon]
MAEESAPDIIQGQACPMCKKKTLTLMEDEREIPYFGRVYIFSMNCSSCHYHQADVEAAEKKEPMKAELEISTEEDMNIRIIKSSHATVRLPHVGSITPGVASNGFVSNVEGILNRMKHQIEAAVEQEDDAAVKKKAKNLLKKLQKVMWGHEKLKLIIEDPTGNSAIISDKTKVSRLKK